jgi:predicted kinase
VHFPEPALIAMVGAAGSGKSTVARAFPPGWRLELDALRALAAGSPGDQSATPAAVAAFRTLLDARLERRLSVVVDSTNTDTPVRLDLLRRARTFGVPAVAIVSRTPLDECLARQHTRPKAKQVPPHAVTRQHAAVPTHEQLLAEGWDQVHNAADLDLLHMLLQRSATSGFDAPLADVLAVFGDALTGVFTPDRDDPDTVGVFAIAGREITVRWADAEPFDHHWQARLPGETCACGGDLWVRVIGPGELLAVYDGRPDEEALCDHCDA